MPTKRLKSKENLKVVEMEFSKAGSWSIQQQQQNLFQLLFKLRIQDPEKGKKLMKSFLPKFFLLLPCSIFMPPSSLPLMCIYNTLFRATDQYFQIKNQPSRIYFFFSILPKFCTIYSFKPPTPPSQNFPKWLSDILCT